MAKKKKPKAASIEFEGIIKGSVSDLKPVKPDNVAAELKKINKKIEKEVDVDDAILAKLEKIEQELKAIRKKKG